MSDQQSSTNRSFSPYLPIFLLALAMLTNLSFQTFTLVNEAGQLKAALATQEKGIEEGQKMRGQLQEMAKQALALAEKGNVNAASLIDAMSKKGINIKASEPTTAATAEE